MNEKDTETQSQFDRELEAYASGTLDDSHIFNLGKPGAILVECGFPKGDNIVLTAKRLVFKASMERHPFSLMDIAGLDKALQHPIAVFEYGNKEKSQNVIVGIKKGNKSFLVGVHFNQTQRGYEVSDVRGLFPKDNIEWMRWIDQGKMIYGNKKEIQVLVAQQRMTFADVSGKVIRRPSDEHYLDSVDNILQSFGDVNDVFTKNYPMYAINQKAQYAIYREFFDAYKATEDIDIEYAAMDAHRFYEALKHNDKKVIREFIYGELPISDAAKRIYEMGKRSAVEILQDRLKLALKEVAVPITEIPFTRDNYNTLFPRARVSTPLEVVKMGEHQFEKLDARNRRFMLQAVHDVLATPDIVIDEKKESIFGDTENTHLYAKSYIIDDKTKAVQSVVVSIEDEFVSISTHERDINNIVNKIKTPDQLLYAAAQVRRMIEQHTQNKSAQSVVNRIREAEYVNPPYSSISQSQNKSSNKKCFTTKKGSKAHKHSKRRDQSIGR